MTTEKIWQITYVFVIFKSQELFFVNLILKLALFASKGPQVWDTSKE